MEWEWWVAVPSWVGMATGMFGAWRAVKTAREVRARGGSWQVSGERPSDLQVQSLLPYTARQVRLEVPPDLDLHDPLGENVPSDVRPRGVRRFMVIAFWASVSNTVTVHWRGPWGRRHSEEIVLPGDERPAGR